VLINKLNKIIASALNLNEVKKKYKKLYKYLLRNVSMMVTISSIYLLMKGDKESYNKRKELWQYIKGVDKNLAKKLRFRLAGLTYILPGKVGGYITLKGYKLAQKIYKFN
jgi:hypothetical protein